MGFNMADDEWDAEGYEIPAPIAAAPKVSDKWEGEDEDEPVKDSWEDEENEKNQVASSAAAPPAKKKANKRLEEKIAEKERKAKEELGLELNPIPTEEICQHFNELRSDLVLLYELKLGLSTCEYELQALRHQYEALAPGKSLEIPASLLSNIEPAIAAEDISRPKALSEVIDVVGSATTPMRKRKAAIEQNNMLP